MPSEILITIELPLFPQPIMHLFSLMLERSKGWSLEQMLKLYIVKLEPLEGLGVLESIWERDMNWITGCLEQRFGMLQPHLTRGRIHLAIR